MDESLKGFADGEYSVSLRVVVKLLEGVGSECDDWNGKAFIGFVNTFIADNPLAQGTLIVRRNRDIAKGTGTMLSPNDRALGDSYKDTVVLTMYKVTGNKGWDGQQIWMHSLSWLAANGTAAIVCFPGILYRGGAEQKIRRYLVENNFVDCIIQLPANLFFGTSIATCILVMKKGKSDSKTLFIDASNECIKVTNNNKLTPENIDRIVDTYANRAEIAHFSHLAAFEEIEANDFNLSVSTYVEQEDKREKIDIVKLNAEIEEIVKRENVLREEIRKIIGEIEG